MSELANVSARVDIQVKKDAEKILNNLGVSMSSAIEMYLRQIIIHQGLPFEVKLIQQRPYDLSKLTGADFNRIMYDSFEDIKLGNVSSSLRVAEENDNHYGDIKWNGKLNTLIISMTILTV